MNVTHKCHFHPNNTITKFCANKECTLPLCHDCQPIHLEEHEAQNSDPKLMRFNEAYLHAANQLEDFLELQRKLWKELQSKMDSDRQSVIQMMDQYYAVVKKYIDDGKAEKQGIEDKLSKLKKGSIKTLIFYYSGDIQLAKPAYQFEPLNTKFKAALESKQESYKPEAKHMERVMKRDESESYQDERKYLNHQYPSELQSQVTNESKNIKPRTFDTNNVFNGIEEIKGDRYRDKVTRKNIFQQHDKNKSIGNLQNNTSSQISQNSFTNTSPNLSSNQLNIRDIENKYNYNRQPSLDKKYDIENRIDPSPKFNYEPESRQTYNRYAEVKTPVSQQHQAPISFQHRFINKFTGAQQYEQHISKIRQDVSSRDISQNHDTKKYEEKENNTRYMKPSDLETEKATEQRTNQLSSNPSTSYLGSLKSRTMSQTNITDREARKNNIEYDLKRQVLPPEQIRKMLEKRIEERNRILSIKKGENYAQQPNQYEEKGANRKGWETKDSIINQIYGETKY